MKKYYQRPWLKIVEINEDDIMCTSGDIYMNTFYIELNDYTTYESKSRDIWSGTGSDF